MLEHLYVNGLAWRLQAERVKRVIHPKSPFLPLGDSCGVDNTSASPALPLDIPGLYKTLLSPGVGL